MHTDHLKTTPTLSTTVYIMSILFPLFFPNFVAIVALITIFGNAHRPYKHYSNIAKNSLHHVHSFFLIFWLFLTLLTIFGNVHRPCKQDPSTVNNSLHCVYFFSFFSLMFWLEMHTDHVNGTPTLSTTVYIMSILFFSLFSLILWP